MSNDAVPQIEKAIPQQQIAISNTSMPRQQSEIMIAIIQACIVLLASIIFPVLQNYFNNQENKNQFITENRRKCLEQYMTVFPKYISYYSAYIKVCIYLDSSNDFEKGYLGLNRQQAGEYRVKIFQELLSTTSPEIILTSIDSMFSGNTLHDIILQLANLSKQLEDLPVADKESENKCDILVAKISKLHLNAISLLTSELKRNY